MASAKPPAGDLIITPEAVALNIETAGLGSRMIAGIIDTAIQLAVLTGAGLALIIAAVSGVGTEPAIIAFIVLAFLVFFGYYPLFEGMWDGRTPGKRAQRLRVVQKDGHPATMPQILVRNLVRIVDFLPGAYSVGALTMIFTRTRRLGDLAAGTVVVRETKAPVPTPLTMQSPPLISLDTSRLTEQEYGIVRSFLERRDRLDRNARSQLARQLASAFRGKVAGAPSAELSDEAFLVTLADSFRRRFQT